MVGAMAGTQSPKLLHQTPETISNQSLTLGDKITLVKVWLLKQLRNSVYRIHYG